MAMNRREWMLAAVAASGFGRAEELRYPGTPYRDYSRCLPDYLRALASEAYARRNQEIARLTTPAAIAKRQKWSRETFWSLTGGEPERSPLHLKTTGSFERAAYRVEKLVFESFPGLHVPALLYIPKNHKPPFPGVLFQMGHAPNGKAGATYQRCCQGLAQLGYLVLGFDPMGQGERIYYPDASGLRTQLGSPDGEHSFAGKQMLLAGDSATRLQTWDAVRALDVLAAHPLVDAKRLASTGQSGGGTLTMFLVAVDDRLAAAAVMSGNTENVACANFNPPGSTDDAEQNFPGSGPLGWDRWDTLYPFAPKPLLVSVSDKDFFGTYSPRYIRSGWEEFQKLKSVYAVLGKAGSLEWGGTPMPHGLSHDTRLLIYNFFGRRLRGDATKITEEPPVSLESDETLAVSKGGNVVRSFGGATPHAMTVKRPIAKRAGDLAELLRVVRPSPALRPAVVGRAAWRRVTVEALEVRVAPSVFVPAWLYLPPNPRVCLIAQQQSGRLSQWQEEDLFHQLALEGAAICVPDVRGVGDLTPEFSTGAARHSREHNEEEDYAWSSLILGKPLLGQRVTDLLAVLAALRKYERTASLPQRFAAQGRMTVPAEIAMMLDKQVEKLCLIGGLTSFRGIVAEEYYAAPFANFLPRILEWGDLEDVRSAIAPRPVQLLGMLDGAGRPAANAKKGSWDFKTLLSFLRG